MVQPQSLPSGSRKLIVPSLPAVLVTALGTSVLLEDCVPPRVPSLSIHAVAIGSQRATETRDESRRGPDTSDQRATQGEALPARIAPRTTRRMSGPSRFVGAPAR